MGEEPLAQGQPLVVMHESDDVATALRALEPGERLSYRVCGRQGTVEVRQAIPFGHKLALRAIDAGAAVRKYGAVIGRATAAIAAGEHVHIHNLSGVRGRGDLAASRMEGGPGADAARG
jgi:altronate dehydratase small subunit